MSLWDDAASFGDNIYYLQLLVGGSVFYVVVMFYTLSARVFSIEETRVPHVKARHHYLFSKVINLFITIESTCFMMNVNSRMIMQYCFFFN